MPKVMERRCTKATALFTGVVHNGWDVETSAPPRLETAKMSRAEWKHVSWINGHEAWLTKTRKGCASLIEIEINTPTSKGSRLDAYLTYARYQPKHQRLYFNFYMKRRLAHMKQHAFCKRRDALNEITSRIVGDARPKETLVFFGSANFSPTFGGGPASPTTRVLNALKRKCTVFPQKEFRTSKLCCKCHTTLSGFKYPRIWVCNRGETHPRTESYSVRHCTSHQCKFMVWDRDINGAINILHLGLLRLKHKLPPFQFIVDGSLSGPQTSTTRRDGVKRRPTSTRLPVDSPSGESNA